ncbi:MAG: dihydrofolate reductase [Bacteroidales bacterium]|nr:dihydrofolate reductase [Bacteroidales bacterium]
MRKLIAAFNMTFDGFCDHMAIIPDDEVLHYYSELLGSADAIIYGRTTYELMVYWQTVAKNPTGNKPTDEFAVTIDNIPKIVFSHTLKNTGWESARVANHSIEEEVLKLKQQPGRDILVGSPSLIVACLNLNLIDEYRLCVHPVILGNGFPLFKNVRNRVDLKLLKTKTFKCGAVTFYYEPKKTTTPLS